MTKERIYCETMEIDEFCGHGMFRVFLVKDIHGDSIVVECPRCNTIVLDISLDCCEDKGEDHNDMLWEIRQEQMSR